MADIIFLDQKDKSLLAQLDMDARQSITQLAKKVKISKEVANYRLKRLEEKGVILYYFTVSDLYPLGFINIRLHLWLYNYDSIKEKSLNEYLKGIPSVSSLASTGGDDDIVVTILSKDILDAKITIDSIIFNYSSIIRKKKTYIIIGKYYFKHNFLAQKIDFREELQGKRHSAKVDLISFKLLSLISNNSRMQTKEIANSLGISSVSVKERIKKLIKDGIILFFRPYIDFQKIGYKRFRVFLQLKDSSYQRISFLLEYLRHDSHVCSVSECIGDSDLDFEMLLLHNEEINEFLTDLREKFNKIISSFYFNVIHKEHFVQRIENSIILNQEKK